jgi:hypothetical protein
MVSMWIVGVGRAVVAGRGSSQDYFKCYHISVKDFSKISPVMNSWNIKLKG